MLWFVKYFFGGSRCCDIKVCGFTAVLRIYNVEILDSRLQCGVEVLGEGTEVQLGKQILQNNNVEVQFSPRVSSTELSKQVTRGLRSSAGVLKTGWKI